MKLPGVGRKTANVLRGQVFNESAITVDTHVNRLSTRIGFSLQKDPVKKEYELMQCWPKNIWTDLSSLLILHGRAICTARKADCRRCCINMNCQKNTLK